MKPCQEINNSKNCIRHHEIVGQERRRGAVYSTETHIVGGEKKKKRDEQAQAWTASMDK